jgi:hypothetical protein
MSWESAEHVMIIHMGRGDHEAATAPRTQRTVRRLLVVWIAFVSAVVVLWALLDSSGFFDH